ncbi:MAG: VOC family protein [Candidatus Eisenbacteria bacterium]|nr:VOC family protein [Candidatus Eisenbacteria bacterium]
MPRVIHFDVPADDTRRAMDFYKKVFGWEFTTWDGPQEYHLIKTGSGEDVGIDGGLGPRRKPDEMVTATIGVASVDETLNEVEKAGGSVFVPKLPIPTVGWLAYFKDTEGNIFGIMQADPEAK